MSPLILKLTAALRRLCQSRAPGCRYEAYARSGDGGVREKLAQELSSGDWPSDRGNLRCGFLSGSHLPAVCSHVEPVFFIE